MIDYIGLILIFQLKITIAVINTRKKQKPSDKKRTRIQATLSCCDVKHSRNVELNEMLVIQNLPMRRVQLTDKVVGGFSDETVPFL